MVINVLVFDAVGQIATPDTAAEWTDVLGLDEFVVLADIAGEWMLSWGGDGGRSQHSFTVLDAEGKVSWKQHDGNGGSIGEIIDELDAAR